MTCRVEKMDGQLSAPFLTPKPAPSLARIHHQWIVSSFSTNGVKMKRSIFSRFSVKTQTLRSQGLKWLHLQEWLIWWIKPTGRYGSRKPSYRFLQKRLLAICLHSVWLWVPNAFCLLSTLCWLSKKNPASPLNPEHSSDLPSWKHFLKKQQITRNNPLSHLDQLK